MLLGNNETGNTVVVEDDSVGPPTRLYGTERILYLNHPESDYGGAFLYNGLCEVFGEHSIYDYPRKHSFHTGQTHFYEIPEQNLMPGQTGPLAWWTPRPYNNLPGYSGNPEEEMNVDHLRELLTSNFFTMIVMEGSRLWCYRAWETLKDAIEKSGLPILYHDGEDYPGISERVVNEVRPHVYGKREWFRHEPKTKRLNDRTVVAPLPFSIPHQILPNPLTQTERTWEAVAFFGGTWPTRRDLIQRLTELHEVEAIRVGFSPEPNMPEIGGRCTGTVGFPEFLSYLRTAKVSFSFRGFGWDTCRFWEVGGNTLLIQDSVPLHLYHEPIHGEHCIAVPDANSAVNWVKHFVKNPSQADTIRRNGMRFFAKHHTNAARVLQIMQYIRN